MREIYAVAPSRPLSIEEKHLDFFLNRPSWHQAFLRRIGIVQSKGKGESEQEQARQILFGLCALFLCMAKILCAPLTAKAVRWAPLYWVSYGGIDTMLFANETNMHVHDRMFNNTSLRQRVMGESCIICAMFRVMKQFFHSVKGLATSDDFSRWENRLTGNGCGVFLGKLLQTMIKNAEMYGLSAEMVTEAKRCHDFVSTLNNMAGIQYNAPTTSHSVFATFFNNINIQLFQEINNRFNTNIFTENPTTQATENAGVDSPSKTEETKSLTPEKQKRTSPKRPTKTAAEPSKFQKKTPKPSKTKREKLPQGTLDFTGLDPRGGKKAVYALLVVVIRAFEGKNKRFIEDKIWWEIERDSELKKLFEKKPNFSNAKKNLGLLFERYGLRWAFIDRTFQLKREKQGRISDLKKLRDILRKEIELERM